jgi:hypothetical protein
MTEHDGHIAGWEGYRALGLVDNPFRSAAGRGVRGGGHQAGHPCRGTEAAHGDRRSACQRAPPSGRVLKSSDLPAYYPRSAMTTVLRELGAESETGLLPVYVQLIMMRKGRIRGTLSALAELVVARSIDLTIARYAHRALSEPDTSLPEWEAVSELDVAELLGRFETEPEATVERVWCSGRSARRGRGRLAEVMRESGMRQAHQPATP